MFYKFLIYFIDKIRFNYISVKSTCKNIVGEPLKNQPVLLSGKGKIIFGSNVQIGYYPSPLLYSTYAHIEARTISSEIKFGNRIFINNNLSMIAEKSKIEIGDDVLIGCNVQIYDSDFHAIHPEKRNAGVHHSKSVVIKQNVFIGNNVIILKGVTIGKNSIISAGAVVYDSFPDNVIIGGNPAIIIKQIEYEA